jgi:ABC-type microcin C transport system permease subunit YejB
LGILKEWRLSQVKQYLKKGFILMQIKDEEKSFWMFTKLMNNEENGLRGLFLDKLPKLKLMYYQIDKLVSQILPNLYVHFLNVSFSTELYVTPFVLTLCTNKFKFSTTLRIWDIFLNEGWKFIIRLIIGIIFFKN